MSGPEPDVLPITPSPKDDAQRALDKATAQQTRSTTSFAWVSGIDRVAAPNPNRSPRSTDLNQQKLSILADCADSPGMKRDGIKISGHYSRLAPRHPVDLNCSVVEIIERRRPFRRTQEEHLTHGEVFEISVNGAGVIIRRTDETQDLCEVAVGQRVTVRVREVDGLSVVRHVHVSRTEVRFGVEFVNSSQEFRDLVNGVLASLRSGGRSLEARWECSH